ncbi:MAG: hypothetical protein NUV32_04840 [Exilispira sp.]|nr:hypothetical protein [Exilispira sp.]
MGISILGVILISIAISIIISIIFRALDKSNQQLSKLKLFVEKSIKDLDAFIVEKKQIIKDLTIDIDFHIKQAQSLSSKYEKQHNDIMLFFSKFQDQKQEIDQLKKSIKLISETKDSLSSEIAKLENFNSKIEQFKKELASVENQCNSLSDSLFSKQESMREQVESYLVELHEKANSVIQQNAKLQYEKLKTIEQDLNKKIEELKGELNNKVNISEKNFESILNKFEENVQDKLNSFKDKFDDINESFKTYEENIINLQNEKEDEFEKSISEIIKSNEIRIDEKIKSLESLRNSINLLYIQLEEKVDLFDDTISSESEKMVEKFNKDLLASFAEKTKKIEEYLLQSEKQLNQVTQKIDSIQDAVDKIINSKVADIGKYVIHLEQRIANYQETVYKEIEKKFTNLDLDARAIIEQYKNEIAILNTESFSLIEERAKKLEEEFEEIIKQQKGLKDEYLNKFQDVLKENEEIIKNSLNQFNQQTNIKIEDIKKDFNLEIEKIIKDRELKLSELESNIINKKNILDNQFNEIIAAFEKSKNEFKEKIQQFDLEIPKYSEDISKKLVQFESKINNLVETRISEIAQSILVNQDKYIVEFDNIYKDFLTKGNNFIQELNLYKNNLVSELKEFSKKKEEVFSELGLIKEYINQSMDRYDKDIEEKIKDIEKDVLEQFTKIKESKDQVEIYIKGFEEKKNEIEVELKKVKENIFENAQIISKEAENKVLQLEDQILEKMKENSSKFETIEKEIDERLNKIKDKVETIENRGTQEIEKAIEIVIKRIEKEKEFMLTKIPELYKQLEEYDNKIDQAKLKVDGIEKQVEEKVKTIELDAEDFFNKIKASGNEKIVQLENRIVDFSRKLKEFEEITEKKYIENSHKFDQFCQIFQEEASSKLKTSFEMILKEFEEQKEKIKEQINNVSANLNIETEKISKQNTEKIEILFNQSYQKIIPKQQEIEKNISRIETLIVDIEKKYQNINSEMDNNYNEYREEIFKRKEEISIVLDKFEKELEHTKMDYINYINDVNKKIEEKSNNIHRSFENQIKELLEELEQKYIDTAVQNLANIDARYKELSEKKDEFNEMIKNLQNIVDLKVTKILVEKEQDMNEIISRSKANLKSSIENVLSSKDMLLEDFKNDLFNMKNKSTEIFTSIEEEIKEKFEGVENKFRLVNEEFNRLENKNSFLSQIRDDIGKIDDLLRNYKEQLEILNSKQKETEEFLKSFEGIDKDLEDYSKKIFELRNERKTLARLEETFDKLVVLSAKADNQFNKVQNDMEIIDNVKNRLIELDQMFKKVTEKFGLLKQYDNKLSELNDNIQKLENEFSNMYGESQGIKELIESTKNESKNLHERLLNLEKEILSIDKESKKFDSALEKFSQMDGFILDLEERNKQLEQKQVWLTKTEDRLEKLNSRSEELIEQLELLIEKTNVILKMRPEAKRSPVSSEDKSETILELYRQGWSEEEIARVTNKSIAEVELTIKLYGQKK